MRPLLTSRDLGAAIAAARKERGWSQAVLAEKASVARPWLSSLENGKPTVFLDGVLRVVIALDLGLSLVPTDADADASISADLGVGGFNLNQYLDDWNLGGSSSEPAVPRHE